MCSLPHKKIEDELQTLINSLGIARWSSTQTQLADWRPIEAYRQQHTAFHQSQEYQAWTKRYSCPHTIVGSQFASTIDCAKWAAVEMFFDLIEWGGKSPEYVLGQSCHIHNRSFRLRWTDKYEQIDLPNEFIFIPTSSIPADSIDTKLQNFKEKNSQPARIPLKEIGIEMLCKDFEKYVQPIHALHESDEEWQMRMMKMFIKIFDHARVADIKNADTISSGSLSSNEPLVL